MERSRRREPDRGDGARRTSERRATYARSRARARQLMTTPRAERWLQVNLSLFPEGPRGALFAPWPELRSALDRWRAEQRFQRFFFVRKLPALRLRFSGDDLAATLEPALVGWLEDAERRNLIRSFRFAVYEPETFRFGGPAGMAAAHHQFALDSQLVLRYETLATDDRAALPRDALSLALMNNLFDRFVEDDAELWDIWRRLWMAIGAPSGPPPDRVTAFDREHELLTLPPSFVDALPPTIADLLGQGLAANDEIAARLRAAMVRGRIEVGPRAWLAEICVFHWNRLALGGERAERMIARMLHHLDQGHDGG